ncbi:MAG: SGNH/GDSL hydrolase family protein [Pelomonas sp.]|nr:SGNH/GDSL hydrolase family protein [Roseateles sp.]
METRQYRACPGPLRRGIALVLAAALGSAAVQAAALADNEHWVSAWGSAQMVPDGGNLLPDAQWRDTSLREIVRVSLPAHVLRVRVSNAFGVTPLELDAASVGLAQRAGDPALQPGSVRALRFNGETHVMVPAGAEYLSDPVELDARAGADLAVSLHFLGEPARQTGHPGARAKTFLVHGNQVMVEQWSGADSVERWYALADVEVRAPRGVGALVAIGDSITDGHGVATDSNTRWTDLLAERLQREHAPAMGIVNNGIGGGRLLRDGLGPNLESRVERDLLTRAGVTHAVVLIGVNDLGNLHRNGGEGPAERARLVADLELGLVQLVERAHAAGICVIGGTVTPYMGSDYYRPDAANEADRQQLNAWIRTSGRFDAVADFDAATRDPAHPDTLSKAADLGDGLHPGLAGRQALADALPLDALRSCKWQTRP